VDGLQRFSRRLQSFGGNAAAVEAGAAQPFGFHKSDFSAAFGGSESGNVAARASTDDGDAKSHDDPALKKKLIKQSRRKTSGF